MGSNSQAARQAGGRARRSRRAAVIAWLLGSLAGLALVLIVAARVLGL